MPHILITGVSTGIGRATANLYAQRGWQVTGTVRDADKPRPEGLDGAVALESLDLGVPGSGGALAQRLLDTAGCPDVVLSNAGMVQFGALEDLSSGELARIFQVNFFGQHELIRALLPAFRQRGSGTIANVTSLGGTITFPFFGGYNSSKWAFEGYSEGLWHELKPFGIRVKAIEPGFVQTAIWNKALPGEGADVAGTDAYRPFLRAMLAFEAGISDRTSPEACAQEIVRALDDDSDRLRYPVAAYARPIVSARRLLGGQRIMRFFHTRWMGKNA